MILFNIFQLWKSWISVSVNIWCASAGIRILMSICDGLGPYTFSRKMENMRPMMEEMDEKMFISRQSWHFFFIVDKI